MHRRPSRATSEGDNTERVLIEANTFEDITAEGADLKEGTDSGTLRGNVFRRVGGSGKNSADSAVDAKGNGWLIEGNRLEEPMAEWDDDGTLRPSELADGFQAHTVYDGYGTGNTFRANVVDGAIPGFGIGLYPANDNVVTCDNQAPGRGQGPRRRGQAGHRLRRLSGQSRRSEARSAPARSAASFSHTTDGATSPIPADVSNPQSVPAMMRRGSPTERDTVASRSATTSGCST